MAINGTNGDDFIDQSGATGSVQVNGNNGDDTVIGSAFSDTLHGNNGDDTLTGGFGNDTIDGHNDSGGPDGFDAAVYSGSILDYAISFGNGNRTYVTDLNLADGDEGSDELRRIEVLQFNDFSLRLDGFNNAPLITGAPQSTGENSILAFALGIYDFDGDTTAVTASVSGGGTLTQVGVPTSVPSPLGTGQEYNYSFDPGTAYDYLAVGETAVETITVTADDGNGGVTIQTFDLTINGENDGPTANNDTASTDEDTAVITASVLANDTDPDTSDILSVASFDTTGTLGTVTDNGNGTFTYDPNGQFESLGVGATATDTFSYTVTDGNGGTDTATVTVTITGVNDAPTANDDTASTDEDTAVITASVLANDTDPDTGDVLSVSAFDTTGTAGTVTNNGNGTFTYDPNGQFESLGVGATATDTFSYTVTDGNGGSDTATVTVTITGVNDAPTANDDTASTDEDTAVTTASVLANDTDPDTGDVLSVASADAVSANGGIVTNNGNGTFTYDPNGQFESLGVGATATDTFSYTVTDGNGGTDTATVTVTITGVNDAPTAADDSGAGFTTDEDSSFTTASVLANDSDPETDPLSVTGIDTTGTVGLVTDNGDGTFGYDPNGQFESLAVGETATDTFTYTVSDGNGGTDTATVTITITGANDGPTANDDGGTGFTTDEDTFFTTASALANDTDPDGDSLLTDGIDLTGTIGTVLDNGNGSYVYDPNGQFEYLGVGDSATDTFSYTVSDGNGGTDTATVTVTVTGLNDAPGALVSTFDILEDQTGAIVDLNSLVADPDAGDVLTISGVTLLPGGAVTSINETGGVISVDTTGFDSLSAGDSESFQVEYTVSDGNGGVSTETLTVDINGVNDQPLAADDTASIDEGSGDDLVIDLGPLTSDVDANDVLSYSVLSITNSSGREQPINVAIAGSVLTIDPVEFGLDDGEVEDFTILYQVTDDSGAGNDSATGEIVVTVTGSAGDVPPPTNNQPVAGDTVVEEDDETDISVDLLNLVTDADPGDTLTVVSVEIAAAGREDPVAFTLGGDGVLTIDPTQFGLADGEELTLTASYTVDDGSGQSNSSDTGEVVIVITGVATGNPNNAPVAQDDTIAVDEAAGNVIIDLNALVSDVDPDTLTITSAAFGDEGGEIEAEFTLVNGVVTVDPTQFGANDGETITVSLGYTVDDGSGAPNSSATGVVTLNITGAPSANAAPVAEDDTQFLSVAGLTTIAVDLTDLISDPDGDPVSIVNDATLQLLVGGVPATVQPTLGSGDTVFIDVGQFALGEDDATTAVLQYTATDGSLSDTGAITLELTGNRAPTATPLTVNYDLDVDTGNISFDLNTLVSDPDPAPGDTLTITVTSFVEGEEATAVTFTNTGNVIELDPAQFGLVDGEATSATLVYTVDDGNGYFNSVETGAVTVNVTNPEPVATGVTLNFDDVDDGDPGNFLVQIGVYEDFVFSTNAAVVETDEVTGRGGTLPYTNGDSSPFNALTNLGGDALEIYSPGTILGEGSEEGVDVELESAFLSGVFRDGMTVTATGYTLETFEDPENPFFFITDYVATGAGQTFTVGTGPATQVFFDSQFDAVSLVTFEVSGGTNAGLGGDGTLIMLDDMVFNFV